MTSNELLRLQLRLRNCLQTILELEPDLKRMELGYILLDEYEVLKILVKRLDKAQLIKDDVIRIERATESFLNELRIPLANVHIIFTLPRLVQ